MRITDAQNEHFLQIILEEAFGYTPEYAHKLVIWTKTEEGTIEPVITPKHADFDAFEIAQRIVNRIFNRGWGGAQL